MIISGLWYLLQDVILCLAREFLISYFIDCETILAFCVDLNEIRKTHNQKEEKYENPYLENVVKK